VSQKRKAKMKPDSYTKVLLTIIAVCLVVLTLSVLNVEPVARAQSPFRCSGEAKANAFGGIESLTGGYEISLRCF